MTTRTRTILIVLATLLFGAVSGGVAGGYIAIRFTAGFFGDGSMLGNGVEVQTQVALLQNIRSGQIEKATELLETQLDGKIISLSISEEYTERTNIAVTRAIQKAKDYRSQYPRRTTSQEVDNAVNGVLRKAQSNELHHP